jgi:hypothetical protein
MVVDPSTGDNDPVSTTISAQDIVLKPLAVEVIEL